jgi:hypothetical protein
MFIVKLIMLDCKCGKTMTELPYWGFSGQIRGVLARTEEGKAFFTMVSRMPETDPVPEPINEHFHTEQQWQLVLCGSSAIVMNAAPTIPLRSPAKPQSGSLVM